jgi:hypothetical protein
MTKIISAQDETLDKQGNTRPALDMVASQVLTVYQVDRKRAAPDDGVARP